VFLAPSAGAVSPIFRRVETDDAQHATLVADVQRFRGGIYLKDGAIQAQDLTADGRHLTAEDDTSWHMLLLDEERRVKACALYLEHEADVTFDQLRVRHAGMAHDTEWRPKLMRAVQSELNLAKAAGMRYVELGGWAVTQDSRGTAGPLALALAVYGFSRRGAGALGMTTATFRHCSATILKRLGGDRFEVDGQVLPPYFDSRYQCLMELLRFDSRKPNSKYLGLIDQVRDTLQRITVVARESVTMGAHEEFAEGLAS